MPAQEPLGKQFHFAQEQFPIVSRQAASGRVAGGLHRHQCLERIAVQPVDIPVRHEFVEVLARPQIRQQQQSLRHVPRQYDGYVQVHSGQRLRDRDERCDIFLVRRSIHCDAGLRAAGDAKIPAKTCIGGCRLDPAAGESQIVDDPSRERRQAGIACIR